MKSKYFIKLLYLLKKRDELDELIRDGLEYSQIAVMILEAKKDGLIENTHDGLKLTESGLRFISSNSNPYYSKKEGNRRNFEKFKIKKRKRSDIYLPVTNKFG